MYGVDEEAHWGTEVRKSTGAAATPEGGAEAAVQVSAILELS